MNGESIYSEEVVWFPKLNSDPQYHYDGIYDAMKTAVEKMGEDVDAIGDGGNVIYINKKHNIVVSVTGYFKPMIFDRVEFIEKNVVEALIK